MMRAFDTEVELLVRCVDPGGTGSEDRIESLLAADPDWNRLLDLARAHGVTPALERRLGGRFVDAVPDEVVSRLEGRARSVALRNVRLADELHDIADAFADAGVRWLPFKGPVLAAVAYGDVARREYKDVDLLVHRADASRAVDLLEARGFELRDGVPRRDDAALLGGPFTKPLTHEYTLSRDGVEVEVRCAVGAPHRPFAPDVETLWARRTVADVAGSDVPTLSQADRLLVLAFHGTKHVWHLLKWACDFAAAASTVVDWTSVFERARETGNAVRLRVGLALTDGLFDVELPPAVRDRCRGDERAMALARQAVDGYADGRPTRPSSTERLRYNASASDSVRDRLAMVRNAGALRPSIAEYRLLPLPGALHPLYFLLYPFRAVPVPCARLVGDGNVTEGM